MSEDIAVAARGRGRPPGSIRPVFFILGAIKNNEMIMEKVWVTRGETITEDDMQNEAIVKFKKEFGVEPEKIFGTCFDAILTQHSTNKRESIRISVDDISYSGRKEQAIYNGWHVLARYIEDESGAERSDVVEITYKKEISQGAKPKGKPHPTLKKISELEMMEAAE